MESAKSRPQAFRHDRIDETSGDPNWAADSLPNESLQSAVEQLDVTFF